MTRLINSAGLALIKECEGLRLEPYLDTGNVWTCGFGHVKGVNQFTHCTPEIAEAWLESDLQNAEEAVCDHVKDHISDNQFAALVSFTFNLGEGALKKLLAHGIDAVPTQILKWDHDNGNVIPGLTKRRKAESNLWSMK